MQTLHVTKFRESRLADQDVVKRVLSGEKELYEILLRRYNQRLYRVIRGYLNSHEDVQDIMQEAYLTAYEKLDSYRFEANFSTWLIRIGINKALARIKKNSQLIIQSDESDLKNPIIERSDEKGNQPENKLIQMEMKEALENAIDQLPKKYRAIYVLKEVEELPISEISELLDISISNVKVRAHRAKNLIKDQLMGQIEPNEIFEFGFSRCDLVVEHVMRRI